MMIVWAAFLLLLAAPSLAVEDAPSVDPRIFITNANSTLIPIGTSSAIGGTVAVVALILGAIFIYFYLVTAARGGNIFAPWTSGLYGSNYNSQYYQQQQQQQQPQSYNYYEPYSKLSYQTR